MLISGGGTTLRNLLAQIEAGTLDVEVSLVVSSSAAARGLAFATEAGVPAVVVARNQYDSDDEFSRVVFDHCRRDNPDLVVMGGFLKRVVIPDDFENRVVNIHPSLIPAFCGQGFYGIRVHRAVLEYGAKISGCTVHFVDNQYDHGPIIFQRAIEVTEGDTPDSLAERVFEIERQIYPEVLRMFAAGRVSVEGRRVSIDSH